MLSLRAYPSKEEPFGFVEDRDRGKRIIIIVDDKYNLPDWHQNTSPSGLSAGLLKMYKTTRTWEMTRAIGFFNLPDPTRLEEDSRLIIEQIHNWLLEVCRDNGGNSSEEYNYLSKYQTKIDSLQNYEYYILVDLFFGANDNKVGDKFITYWKEHRVIPGEKEKIAYFSVAGSYVGDKDPHELRIFRKGEIDEIDDPRKLPIDLQDWLDFETVPLENIWEKSTGWFDDTKKPVVKHNFHEIGQWFLHSDSKSKQYQDSIKNALGFNFPEAWWQDTDTIVHIHESLKHLCGEVFCGNTQINGCRNISVGAAFIISLKAHYEIFGDLGLLAEDPHLWQNCFHVTARLLPLQEQAEAKSSAIAIYDFFYHIFLPRSSMKSSPVRKVYFEQQGSVLKIQVNWNATQPASNRSKSLVEVLNERFNNVEIGTPDPDDFGKYKDRKVIAKNTRDAISRLWRSFMFNKNGFLSPGVIYMEEDEIIIASTEYLI